MVRSAWRTATEEAFFVFSVCLVQSQTVAALALTAGAVIEFGSVLLWRRILRHMTGGAAG